MDQTWLIVLLVVAVLIAAAVVLGPRLGRALAPRMAKAAGEAYQKRLFKRIRKQYPLLAERLAEFELTPGNQEAFQNAIKRLPPQEALKLQAEFNRLRDNFLTRHPEIAPMVNAGQDGRAQAKAMEDLLKLPADRRAALEKDLLWAWDQLRGRFPKLVGGLEAAYRRRNPPQA